jgi:hypothetical protein
MGAVSVALSGVGDIQVDWKDPPLSCCVVLCRVVLRSHRSGYGRGRDGEERNMSRAGAD